MAVRAGKNWGSPCSGRCLGLGSVDPVCRALGRTTAGMRVEHCRAASVAQGSEVHLHTEPIGSDFQCVLTDSTDFSSFITGPYT